MSNFNLYHDKAQQADLPSIVVNDKLNDPNLYVPSTGLMSAVNVALQLGQPLLLTGEPGTGKTQLAYHIAHFFIKMIQSKSIDITTASHFCFKTRRLTAIANIATA